MDKTLDKLATGTRVVTAPELDPSEDFDAYRCPNKPGTVRENVVLAPSHRTVNHDDGTSAIYLCAELDVEYAQPAAPGTVAIPTEAGVYLYGPPDEAPDVAILETRCFTDAEPERLWRVAHASPRNPTHAAMQEQAQRKGWVFSRLDGPWPPATTDPAPAGTRPLLDRVSRHIEHAIDQGALGVHVITIGGEIEAQGFGEIDEADLVYALERSKLEGLRPEREPACGYADE